MRRRRRRPRSQSLLSSFSDCERIRVPALELVRQLILGSVYANAPGMSAMAQQSYRRAIDLGRKQQEAGEQVSITHISQFGLFM